MVNQQGSMFWLLKRESGFVSQCLIADEWDMVWMRKEGKNKPTPEKNKKPITDHQLLIV